MKYVGALAFIFALVSLFSCVGMPEITKDGVSPDKERYVPFYAADDHAEKMMMAGGYAKPVASLQDESELWLWLAALNGGLMSLSFIWAYLSHQHSMIGAGFIFGLLALFCTGVSAAIGYIWIGVGVALLVALVWLGREMRTVSVIKWFQDSKEKEK